MARVLIHPYGLIVKRNRIHQDTFDTWFAWFFAIGIVGYPAISFVSEFVSISSRFITVPFRLFFLAFSILIIVQAVLRGKFGKATLLLLPLSVFWILYVIRIMIDSGWNGVNLRLSVQEYYLYAIGTCFIPTIAFLINLKQELIDKALSSTFVLLFFVALLSLFYNFDQLGQEFIRLYVNELLNPITIGHMGVSLIVCASYSIYNQSSKFYRIVCLISIPLGFVLLLFSASRSPILALILMLLIYGVFQIFRGRIVQIAILLAFVLGLPY
jgi:hypothetical protein